MINVPGRPMKVLIICYYWPPAGGPGVQRWLSFVKNLPQLGIEPIVYIPENASYPTLDTSLLADVPFNLVILKRPISEPYKWAERFSKQNKAYKAGHFQPVKEQSLFSKLSIFIRGNFFIPDARIAWIKPSIKYLENYIAQNNIDTVITSGPPHSLHLIGLGLKKKNHKIKWLADFRDPWTTISYHHQLKLLPFTAAKHKRLEYKVLSSADLVISTSYTDAEHYTKLGAKKIKTITNGYDTMKVKNTPRSKKFILTYVGSLEFLRNPKVLWQALAEITNENDDFTNDFELQFVGNLSIEVEHSINAHHLKPYIVKKGYLTHNESISAMQNSTMLWLVNFDHKASRGIIPGKLFEYIAANKPILAIGPENADVEIILQKINRGTYCSHRNIIGVRSYILDEYENWKNDSNTTYQDTTNEFNRLELTKKLVAEINHLHS